MFQNVGVTVHFDFERYFQRCCDREQKDAKY